MLRRWNAYSRCFYNFSVRSFTNQTEGSSKVRGQKLLEEGKYNEARTLLTEAIRSNPVDADLYKLRADALLKIPGNEYLAIFDGYKSTLVQPNNFMGYRQMGQAFMAHGKYARAKGFLQKSLQLSSNSDLISKELLAKCEESGVEELAAEVNGTVFTPKEEEVYLQELMKDNPFIEIKHTPGMGRGVFAKVDIPTNTQILEQPPIVAITVRNDVCQQCFTPFQGSPPVTCEECGTEHYCSSKCKDEAFKEYHEVICTNKMSETRESIKSVSGSSAKSILLALKYVGITHNSKEWITATEKGENGVDPFVIPQIRFLKNDLKPSVDSVLRNMETFNNTLPLHLDLIIAYFDAEFVGKFLAACLVNAFNIVLPGDGDSFSKLTGSSIGLYEIASYFNHSCDPSVLFTSHYPVGKLITTRKVQKGEQLFTTYIDINLPKEQRQEKLLSFLGTKCTCSKCVSEL